MKASIRGTLGACTIAGATLLAGCAGTTGQPDSYHPQQSNDYYPAQSNDYSSQQSNGYYPAQQQAASYGVIDSIQMTRAAPGTSGAGVVAGGLVGGLLGNQIGSGTGRSVATVAGAVGGAMLGNEVEKSRAQARDAYQIGVRLENGDYRIITQDSAQDLRVGGRVRVIDGRAYRY